MKILTITLSVLTIILLVALIVSIVKNEKKSINNEKKYTLLYIISIIFLMISNIMSTLINFKIAMIFFIIFLILLIIATINYIKIKNKLSSQNKHIVPNRLKKNLKIIKEDRDGYFYKAKVELECCGTNDFKIQQLKSKELNIVQCICNKCNKKYEIYNSETDGYILVNNDNIKIIKEKYMEYKCSKCNNNLYKIEINYEYEDEIEEFNNIDFLDITNIYSSIKVNIICNKCNKKERGYINHEFK